MSLMKKMTDECFKWTLCDSADDRSDDMPMIPEGNPEHGCYIAQINLENELCVLRAQRRIIIEQGRQMNPVFRMLPKIIMHWNCTRGSFNEYSMQ